MADDIAGLIAQTNSLFPDNTSGEISPVDLRTSLQNIISSNVNNQETASQALLSKLSHLNQLAGVIVINAEADFPAQDATTITIGNNNLYAIGKSFSTGKRFVLDGDCAFTAFNLFGPVVTYTGTGDMFTGVNKNFQIRLVSIVAATGRLFNFTGAVGTPFLFIAQTIGMNGSKDVGVFDDMGLVQFDNCSGFITGTGVSLVGGPFLLTTFTRFALISTSSTFVGIDLGSATTDNLELDKCVLNSLDVAGIGLKGLASSANITTGTIATVDNVLFGGAGSPLSGITVDDVRFRFSGNSANVIDSHTQADTYLTASRTVTNPGLGVFVDIGGSDWVSDFEERISGSTSGVLTYNAEGDQDIKLLATATIEKSGGGADELAIRLRHDAASLAKSESVSQSTSPTSVTSQALIRASETDPFALQIANLDSGANDMIVSSANLIVSGS